jgi:hypothetical protein
MREAFYHFLLSRTSYVPEEIVWGAKFTFDTLEELETHLMANYRNITCSSFAQTYHCIHRLVLHNRIRDPVPFGLWIRDPE